MVGMVFPEATRWRCSSRPVIPGICTSAIRQKVRENLARVQELFCRREGFGRISQRLHEAPDCLAHRLIIIDDRDQGIGLRHFTSFIGVSESMNALRSGPLGRGTPAAFSEYA